MVRKWSYLNITKVNERQVFKPLLKTKSFKVFRKTTRFKKFTRGITKAVRQKYAQRKFNTSYYVLKHITKWWSFSYVQAKQVERFIQSMSYSLITSSSPNHDVFYSIIKTSDLNLNSHLFSCSKKLVYRFLKNDDTKNVLFTKTQIKDSKLSFMQTNSFESQNKNLVVNPLTLYLNNTYYHPYASTSSDEHEHIINKLVDSSLNHLLNITITTYKILILTTLVSTK